ncbi:MAG TPA: hypothetical protein VN026_13675 [Bacteroidia bacterium]|jgi:hypothetical protein|nr:hypothetical protein [Bacteroidia bacterium]
MKKITVYILAIVFSSQFLFSQTDLNYYINAAKQNSPLINDNQNLSKVNQLEAERLKAFYTKPQVGITANYMFSPIINLDNNQTKFESNSAGADKYLGYDFAAANGGQYQALLNITQPVLNNKKLKTATEQVNVISQINQNNVKLTGHDIEKIITDQYILCLQGLKQTDYANSVLEILSEQKDIIKKLVESSIYKQSDLSLLNIEYQNFLFQQTTFKANYKRDLMDLRILCGIKDTSFVILNELDLKVAANTENSFFSEKYRLDSLNLIASKNIFELKYKPQLNLVANTGLNAVYAPTLPNRFGFNAGFTFAYNFFDGKQKNINRNKTDILLKSVSFYKESFVTQNTMRKTKILNELQSYIARISIAEQQLKEYSTLLNLYKKEILTGQLSIINYVMVLKNMAAMQRDNTILSSQKQSLINAYNYWNW